MADNTDYISLQGAWSVAGGDAATTMVPIGGTMAFTDDQELLDIEGSPVATGSFTATDGQEKFTHDGVGTVTATGSMTLPDGQETVVITGEPLVDGSMSLTEARELITAVGEAIVEGELSLTDEPEEVKVFEEDPPPVATLDATVTDRFTIDISLTD